MKTQDENAVFEKLLLQSGSISFGRFMVVVASRWHWIAGSVLMALLVCYAYLKTAAPLYEASIILRFQEKQSALDDLKGKSPAMIVWRTPREYLAEKYHVASHELLEKTLKRMDAPFSFRRIKNFRKVDVYPFRPVVLGLQSFNEAEYENGTFRLDKKMQLHYFTDTCRLSFPLIKGTVIWVPGLLFSIDSIRTGPGFRYEFTFDPYPDKARSLAKVVELTEIEDNLPILKLSFRHHNEEYTRDFLTHLAETYSEYTLHQKQASSDLTIRFIGEQKELLADSLKHAAAELAFFKQRNQLLDINASTTGISIKLRELEQEKQKMEIQNSFIGLLEKNLSFSNSRIPDYWPTGLDASSDAVLVSLIDRYNHTFAKRAELALKYHEGMPAITLLDDELREHRVRITDNINLQKRKSEQALEILENTITAYKARFDRLPEQERNLLYFQRRFEMHQSIYSLLLNKEVESSLFRAGMLPSFTVLTAIDVLQLFPKKIHVVILSVFSGILAGIGLIFLRRGINRRFTAIDTIRNSPEIAVSGVIQRFQARLSGTPEDLDRLYSGNDLFTESINALRTKLLFSKTNLPEHNSGRLVMLTSEQAGEGKSFLTVNLALSLARIKKKVLIVGGDLRKPRIDRYFENNTRTTGLSEWLEGSDLVFGEVIYHSRIQELDYIPGGKPVAFPGELLQKERFYQLIDYARSRYDYILLDTAPVGLVADNLPLLNRSDHVIYVIRWLHSGAATHLLAGQLIRDYHIAHMMVVVNDFYTDHLYDSLTRGILSNPEYGYYHQEHPRTGNAYFKHSKPGISARLIRRPKRG